MMLRALLLLAGLPLAAWAQLQVFEFDGANENAVNGLYQVPDTALGDTTTTRFRVFNTGSGAATLQNLTIAGDGFQISAAPSVPYVIAPTTFAEFTVAFSPTIVAGYSANLLVNSIAVIVRGSGVASATLSLGGNPLTSGATVDFGTILLGTNTSQTLTISNPTPASVTISSIVVSGTAFKGPAGVSTPLILSAGKSASFQITFSPPAGQLYQGSLVLDG